MINSKLTKQASQQSTEERLFKLLESMDWKLWEMMNMMKAERDPEEKKLAKPLKSAAKKTAE